MHKKIVTPLCVACPVKCAQPSVRLQREEKVVAALEIGQERSYQEGEIEGHENRFIFVNFSPPQLMKCVVFSAGKQLKQSLIFYVAPA